MSISALTTGLTTQYGRAIGILEQLSISCENDLQRRMAGRMYSSRVWLLTTTQKLYESYC